MPRYSSYPNYGGGGGDRIGDLLAQRAQMAGQVQESPWNRGIQDIVGIIGQTAMGIQQNRQQEKEKREQEAQQTRQSQAFDAALASGDMRNLFKVLPPDKAATVANAIKAMTPDGAKKYRDRMELLRDVALGVENSPEPSRPGAWKAAMGELGKLGAVSPDEAQQYAEYDPGISKSIAGFGQKPKEEKSPAQIEAEAAAQARGAASARQTPEQIQAEAAARARGEASGRPPTPEKTLAQRVAEEEALTAARARGTASVSGEKPPTEGQTKAAGFYDRAQKADDVVKALEATGSGKPGFWESFTPDKLLPEDRRLYLQAQRDFTIAHLRPESGAAISKEEYSEDAKTYFPQYGDSKKVIDQKAAARQQILDSLEGQTGRVGGSVGTSGTAPREVKTVADFNTLPNGAEYIDPNGIRRRKRG